MTSATILVCLVVGWALAAALATVLLGQRADRRREEADSARQREHTRELSELSSRISHLVDEVADVRHGATAEVGQLRDELTDVRSGAGAEVGRLRDELADVRRQAAAGRPAVDAARGREEADVPVITAISKPDPVVLNGSRVASVTLSAPLVKAAAFTHGVRRALGEEQRMRIQYGMRKELRRQQKMRRRRRASRGPSEGWGR